MQGEDNQSPSMDARIRAALSHPKRTEIFGHLIREKDGAREAELAAEFGMSVPLVTYHLKVLHGAALIAHLDDGQPDAGHSYVAASSRF